MAHDRAGGDEFPMTQEFAAMMLGVRRAGISLAAGVLQKAGAIRYAYGRVPVLDRARLEAAAGECYGAVRRPYERPLGIPARAGPEAAACECYAAVRREYERLLGILAGE